MALGSLGTLSVKIQVSLQRFLRQLQETEDRLKKTSTKFKQIGKSMSKFITVPLNLAGGMAIKTGMDFEKGMSKVRANLGLTVEQMEILENKAREIGKTTKFSATEAAEAMNYMALAGWDTNQILDSLKATLDLSVASGEDLASVTDIVTDAMTAFKLKSSEAERFVDVLSTTSSSANTNIKMLGEAFSYAAPIAGTLGATVEDSALALGLMANQSIKSSMAGTALRSILTNLSAPTEKVKETLNKLGIEISKTEDGSFDFGNTMLSLRSAFSKLTKEQKTSAAQTIAGKFAMSGLLAVVDATQEDFDKLSGKIEKSSGRAEEMAKVVGENLSGKFAQMKSAIEEVSLIIADRLMPVVEILTKVVITLANKFGNLSPTLQTTIIVIAGIVAAIGPLLVAIGGIITILPTLVTALATITGPIGLTIAAVMGLAAAGIVLYKNWDVLRTKIQNILLSIANVYVKNFNDISNFITDIMNLIQDTIMVTLNLITENWKEFKNNIKSIVDSFISYISNSISNFATVYEEVWNSLKDITVNILNNIKEKITTIVDFILDKISAVLSKISKFKEAVSGIGSKIGSGVKTFTSTKISKLKEAVSGIGSKIVSGVKTFASNMNIRTYATGTNYVPNDGLAYLHKGEAVIPASQNKAGMNGITVNVTGNTISNSRDADKLANTIVSKLRMAGVNP